MDPLDLVLEECYWSGLDEAPYGTGEYHRAALRNIYGDSPFAQPPLNVVEVGVQVAVEQRDVAMTTVSSAKRTNSMRCEFEGMSLTYRLKRTGDINPP